MANPSKLFLLFAFFVGTMLLADLDKKTIKMPQLQYTDLSASKDSDAKESDDTEKPSAISSLLNSLKAPLPRNQSQSAISAARASCAFDGTPGVRRQRFETPERRPEPQDTPHHQFRGRRHARRKNAP